MSTPIKDSTVGFLTMTKNFYLKDLALLSDEQLTSKPNGCARRPIDFSYEVLAVNKGILRTLKQEPKDENQPEEDKDGIWTAAPKGYTRGELETDLAASVDEIIEYLSGLSEEQLLSNIPTWFGEGPLFAFASFAGTHTMYHGAQIAYVAQLGGDMENHWF